MIELFSLNGITKYMVKLEHIIHFKGYVSEDNAQGTIIHLLSGNNLVTNSTYDELKQALTGE